jgi:hypothetical protein
MLILFAIALTLGLLWMLSTTAWGRLRRLQATEFATPPDGLVSRALRALRIISHRLIDKKWNRPSIGRYR